MRIKTIPQHEFDKYFTSNSPLTALRNLYFAKEGLRVKKSCILSFFTLIQKWDKFVKILRIHLGCSVHYSLDLQSILQGSYKHLIKLWNLVALLCADNFNFHEINASLSTKSIPSLESIKKM